MSSQGELITNSVSLPRIRAPKISDAAYEILRENVISKEFVPGQRLDLSAIEEQLGISRTPIKEALARLKMEGLVTIVPRSGTFVTNPSRDEIQESFDLRRVLELRAVELGLPGATAEEIETLEAIVDQLGRLSTNPDREGIYPRYLVLDHEFHRQVVLLSGNRRLIQAHDRENVHAQMARIRYRSAERELDVAQEEHRRIIAAFKRRDVAAAQAEMDAHLRRAARSLLADMEV